MAKNKKKSAPGDKQNLKSILTAPIGGKKAQKDQADPATETETAQGEAAEATGKGKRKSAKSRKGKAGGAKEFTTYDAIKHQKLKLRQEDDIKTFLSRAIMMVIIAFGVFRLLFGFFPMKDNSMAPKLSSGDLLLYYRLDDDFKALDVVVYHKNGKSRAGRVIARPGDSVDIPEDGGLVVNGSQLIETEIYSSTGRREEGVISYPLTLSVNQFFILGDNREYAEDSRVFGPVNASEIDGKVITALRRSGL